MFLMYSFPSFWPMSLGGGCNGQVQNCFTISLDSSVLLPRTHVEERYKIEEHFSRPSTSREEFTHKNVFGCRLKTASNTRLAMARFKDTVEEMETNKYNEVQNNLAIHRSNPLKFIQKKKIIDRNVYLPNNLPREGKGCVRKSERRGRDEEE
ncbi:hypothetical protein P170DRAFT_145746 [Aspergillus steynii IBT 23096]|uniref:Uncharacterized protein n=1 Tax=Aspergillus steynii IBT 23096 TaxID=1392250 RepID=A0A2I2GC79_9EURO|nr:uncharacterized protein P170DRAFT_145746 [Aspergillus steynii IBT 23096]PLB50486.1 hypothetical protein P170DRAFT_145746 [Aspergillus steynii IBT 23096]